MKSRLISRYWPAMALLVYGALQLFITMDRRATATQLLMWTAFALVYICMGELGRVVENRWYLIAPILLFATCEAALGMAQHFTGGSETFATGTYTDHSHFAGLLELA